MANDFDLRAPRPAPIANDLSRPALPGLVGRLPLPPGEVTVVSDNERALLEKIGWRDGMAVPPGLPHKLAELRRELEAEKKLQLDLTRTTLPVDAATPPLRVPPEKQFDQLSPAKQAELRRFMADWQGQAQQRAASRDDEEALRNVDPSVAQAYQEAAGGYELWDSRTAPPHPPAGPTPDPTAPATSDKQEKAPVLCPHCGHDQAQKPPLIEYADKVNFLQAVLGGVRFVKQYRLLGGQLEVVFRSSTVGEANLVQDQMSRDEQNGRFGNLRDFTRTLWDYRLVLGLQSLQFSGRSYDVAAQVDEQVAAVNRQAGDAFLTDLAARMKLQTVFAAETTWRLLVQHYQKFNEVVLALEARAADENFWKATEV